MFIDSHVHLSLFPNSKRLLNNFKERHILPLSVSVSKEDSSLNQEISNNCHNPYLIGVHPLYAKDDTLNLSEDVLINDPLCLGLGECGLDTEGSLSLDLQSSLLKKHLDLACKFNKPISLHIRKAHGELIKLLKSYHGNVFGMIHGFTFSEDLAHRYLDLGFYLSFAPYYLKTNKGIALLKSLPKDRILLESDGDFKNQRNYDFDYVPLGYKDLMHIFNLNEDEIIKLLSSNFKSLFFRNKPCPMFIL